MGTLPLPCDGERHAENEAHKHIRHNVMDFLHGEESFTGVLKGSQKNQDNFKIIIK